MIRDIDAINIGGAVFKIHLRCSGLQYKVTTEAELVKAELAEDWRKD